MSLIRARVSSSAAASGLSIPSPLRGPFATDLATSAASEADTPAHCLPSVERIQAAASTMERPSGLSPIAARGRASEPSSNVTGSFRRAQAQETAAITSGGRTCPSPSVSMIARVRSSIWRPLTGQLSATQSFWSSSPRALRSSAVSSETWSSPPLRTNFHEWGGAAVGLIEGIIWRRLHLGNTRAAPG